MFNGLFVAFGCCLVLYLVSLEVNEKKRIIQENEDLLEIGVEKEYTELNKKETSLSARRGELVMKKILLLILIFTMIQNYILKKISK